MRFPSLVLLFGICIGQTRQDFLEKDIQKAFARAKKEQKLLWVMVSATWCRPCRIFERKILRQPYLREEAPPNYVLLKVYASSDEHNTPGAQEFVEKYKIESFPTFLYLTPEGEVLHRVEGLPDEVSDNPPEEAVDYVLEEMHKVSRNYEATSRVRRYLQEGKLVPDTLRRYLVELYEDHRESQLFRDVLEAYRRAAPSIRAAWGDPEARDILFKMAEEEESYAAYILGMAESLQVYYEPSEWRGVIEDILEKDLQARIKRSGAEEWPERAKQILEYIQQVKERFPFAEELLLKKTWQNRYRATILGQDPPLIDICRRYATLLMNKPANTEEERKYIARELDAIGWAFYKEVGEEDEENLRLPLPWLEYALKLDPENWSVWDTKGAIHYKLGQKKEAIAHLEKALKLVKEQVGESSSDYESVKGRYEQAKKMKKKKKKKERG
ncbi:MAG: thioredoxin family protein [Bacteroidia bacterium]